MSAHGLSVANKIRIHVVWIDKIMEFPIELFSVKTNYIPGSTVRSFPR